MQEYGDLFGAGVVFPELEGTVAGEGCYGGFEIGELGDVVAKRPGGADAFFGAADGLEIEAGLAAEFFDEAQADDGHMFEYPGIMRFDELTGGVDAKIVEFFGVLPADAPEVFDGEVVEDAADEGGIVQHANAAVAFPFFGDVVGEFCQGFGGGDADTGGDPGVLPDGG